MIEDIDNHRDIIELVLKNSNIEIKNPNSAREFCLLKLKSFVKRQTDKMPDKSRDHK